MILRNDYILLGTAVLFLILLVSSPLLLVILIAIPVVILFLDCDFSLKALELYGTKPEESYLRGSVVWITGASSGIGEFVAYELSRCGAHVVLSARNQKELLRVESRCKELKCASSLVLPLDVTNREDQATCLGEIIDKYGKIDVLLNNAGVYQMGYLDKTDFDVVKYVMDLNFMAPMHLTKLVAKEMKKSNTKGLISVVSSIASGGVAYNAAYSASKAAINVLYDSLRGEFYEDGIDLQIIKPGIVRTPLLGKTLLSSKNTTAGEVGSEMSFSEYKPMEVTRCAKLISVALANRVPEVWIAWRVQALWTFAVQYMPTYMKSNRVLTKSMSQRCRRMENRLKQD